MMAETMVGWLLLEAAVIAEAAAAKLPADHPDRAFYDGKRFAAQYFAHNVLPAVVAEGAADRARGPHARSTCRSPRSRRAEPGRWRYRRPGWNWAWPRRSLGVASLWYASGPGRTPASSPRHSSLCPLRSADRQGESNNPRHDSGACAVGAAGPRRRSGSRRGARRDRSDDRGGRRHVESLADGGGVVGRPALRAARDAARPRPARHPGGRRFAVGVRRVRSARGIARSRSDTGRCSRPVPSAACSGSRSASDGAIWVVGEAGYAARVLGQRPRASRCRDRRRGWRASTRVRDEIVMLGGDGMVRAVARGQGRGRAVWRDHAADGARDHRQGHVGRGRRRRLRRALARRHVVLAGRRGGATSISRRSACCPTARLAIVGDRGQLLRVDRRRRGPGVAIANDVGLAHLWSIERFGGGALIGGDERRDPQARAGG